MGSEAVPAAIQDNAAYIGLWTNWSQGQVLGATITLTQRNGGFLIAFLALFVTLTGTCFWMIVAFSTHQILSRETAQDAIYHQRQAILRNAETSALGCWKLVCMLWTWRRHDKSRLIKRLSAPLLMSFLVLLGFTIAGIFSSRVATDRGGEVLVASSACGTFSNEGAVAEEIGIINAYLVQRVQSSSNYALMCYKNNSATQNCRTFVRPSLQARTTRDVSCPFPAGEGICRNASDAVRLDSGLLNSHFDLGINAHPEHRFLYRSVKECAPIRNEGYTILNSSTSPASVKFQYGPSYTHGDSTFTYAAESPGDPNTSYGKEYQNGWSPIPELLVPDGDVSMFFLAANDVRFFEPVEDAWFSARTVAEDSEVSNSKGSHQYYMRDDPARVVACMEKYQFCNPLLAANSSCTPLGGIRQALEAASGLFKDESDRKRFLWSVSAIVSMASGFAEIGGYLGSAALQARSMLAIGLQSRLPNNQWELELENWFQLTLADVQRAILEQATGPSAAFIRPLYIPPNSTEARSVCGNQKIRSDSYTSFNLLGLVLVFTLGVLIMVASLVLPAIVAHIQRRRNPYRRLEWIVNDTLQLQRLAHEAVGAGTWTGACDDYPTTVRGEVLAELDWTDPEHPRLKASARREYGMAVLATLPARSFTLGAESQNGSLGTSKSPIWRVWTRASTWKSDIL
ncbi:hypothetical protein BDV95DRAFT_495673 [Massariosphaeria phaeospora]|uniref:Uncharacterized protein n=1 Tax=Massariosphaeria phaeospora TaxID=100035 RepID=A0A7C8MAP2_9PLEO|nr:hypothetical protein BDV95DRAFT_495673 [Massariosphaeria phaeospora]